MAERSKDGAPVPPIVVASTPAETARPTTCCSCSATFLHGSSGDIAPDVSTAAPATESVVLVPAAVRWETTVRLYRECAVLAPGRTFQKNEMETGRKLFGILGCVVF